MSLNDDRQALSQMEGSADPRGRQFRPGGGARRPDQPRDLYLRRRASVLDQRECCLRHRRHPAGHRQPDLYERNIRRQPDAALLQRPAGPTVGAIIIYIWTGSNATSRLVFYSDEAQGLPIVPDGGDQTITWDNAGLFAL